MIMKKSVLKKAVICASAGVMLASFAATTASAAARVKLITLSNFRVVQQQKDNYCIPACIQSALLYSVNKTPTQPTIDSAVRGDFSKIPGYMNARQSKCHYIRVVSPTLKQLKDKVQHDVTIPKMPTFLRIEVPGGSDWYYSTPGHCVLAIGIYSDGSKIRIGDPLGGRVKGCPYTYLKPSALVGSLTTQLCW